MTAWKLTQQQKGEIVRSYRAGRSIHEIASSFGVQRSSIEGILFRRGVRLPRPRIRLPDDAEILTWYAAGLSPRLIGLIFGVSRKPITRILHRYDIPPTKRQGAKLSETTGDEVVRRFQDGHTLRQLGSWFGVSSRTIGDYLHRRNIDTSRPADFR